MKTYENTKKRLEYFKTLEYNWNGYDAEKLDEHLLNNLIEIFKDVKIQPQIFPTAGCGIQFEWEIDYENHPKTYVELTIDSDNFSIFIDDDIGYDWENENIKKSITTDIINELIDGKYEGESIFDKNN